MEVTPLPKTGRKPKARPKGLRRVGRKAQQDMDELAVARPVVMERCRGRCEVRWSDLCTGRVDHLHHILPRSQGSGNDPDELLGACWSCHDRIHANPAEAVALGFLRRGTDA